jgi:methenyltetrahydrofolate cyclohydrolase
VSEQGFGSERLAGFLEALASSGSTPGGGSAAAVVGAAGAALVAMVGRLTDGKRGYEAVWERMRGIVSAADRARAAFLSLADRDTAAFDAVMGAFRMPKDTDEDRAARSEAIQRAYVDAAGVPAEVARRAVDLMAAAVEAVESGNANAASDGVAAANLLFAAAQAALANVLINASSIRDQTAARRLRSEAEALDGRSRGRLAAAGDAFRRTLDPG